jgi:hypothetical protein
VIPDRPDRVPDAINPLTGYRAWRFDRRGGLFPISRSGVVAKTAWDGADRRWVSATCRLHDPSVHPDSVSRMMENVYRKLGLMLDQPFEFELTPHPIAHAVPEGWCSCGFYAMKELRSVTEPDGPDVILGRVELAGKVIECTQGYRAERARVAELIPVAGQERAALRLARRLGVPLTFYPQWPDEHRSAWC